MKTRSREGTGSTGGMSGEVRNTKWSERGEKESYCGKAVVCHESP